MVICVGTTQPALDKAAQTTESTMHFRFPLIDLGFMTILTFSLVGAAIEAATLHPATVSLLASAGGLG